MNTYIYIFIMAAVTFAIRVTPLTLIRGQIKSRFLRSFLYYVPYVTLSVMTFPAILTATGSIISATLALMVAVILSLRGNKLPVVTAAACSMVLISEIIISIFF